MKEVKFGDLAREYKSLQKDILDAIECTLDSGWFVLGQQLASFEQAFARHIGTEQCVGVASGTDAIALALMACEIGPGDEVVTVAHTAVPTISAISQVGARPVFVDIHPDTCLMNVDALRSAITSRTRAVIPVHLYGQCVDMDGVLSVTGPRGIPVVEDCAQAHGALYKNRMSGTLGAMGAFSFYPSKNLGCYGDGGAIATGSKELAKKLRMLRNYGQSQRYYHEIEGINSRLDEIQAAILSTKLPHLGEWSDRRRTIAHQYNTGLRDLPLDIPVESGSCRHVFHLYVIQTERRDELKQVLETQGIEALIHYPVPAHLQKAYAHLNYGKGDLPVTEKVCANVLSLPLYPQLADSDVEYVIATIREFFAA